ncbi:MAG: Aminotransferase class V [Synergistales bacterium 53_16]|nr:MAG: Aminotransferase class V [Synergistales bacterium 53_16]MDN5336351.1 hypothetical protein [Synergistales bacterium]HAG22917.1 alanine--glyoxylate aminotransferase family protein [Synergistaceae bacterium]
MKRYLFTPGPVPLDGRVSSAMARPVAGHRSREFSTLLLRVQNRLRDLLRSTEPVPLVPGSGTGALEALAVNFTGPGSKVISLSCGVFGERFREIARRSGAEVVSFDIEPGKPCLPEDVRDACMIHPDADVLLLTHNETSTGVCNPLEEICRALPKERPLVLVDAVSSLGVVPLYPEKWGVDAIASCSQKGLMAPPGLGICWLSPRAREVLSKGREASSVFFDLKAFLKGFEKEMPSVPYTPPVTVIYALDAALEGIFNEGAQKRFAARRRFALALAEGFESMGLELLVGQKEYRSPGVTAVKIPEMRAESVREALDGMGLETAGGQGKLNGHIFRVGHFTWEGWPEICLILGSVWAACREVGISLREPDLKNVREVYEREDTPCGKSL